MHRLNFILCRNCTSSRYNQKKQNFNPASKMSYFVALEPPAGRTPLVCVTTSSSLCTHAGQNNPFNQQNYVTIGSKRRSIKAHIMCLVAIYTIYRLCTLYLVPRQIIRASILLLCERIVPQNDTIEI